MKRSALLLALASVLSCFSADRIAKAQTSTSWTTPRHDAQRSGSADVIGPNADTTAWEFDLTGQGVSGLPSVGANGRIYVPVAFSLLALEADGHLAFQTPGFSGWTPSNVTIGDDGTVYLTGGPAAALTEDGIIKWTRYMPGG